MPIFLVEYDQDWPTLFLEEKELILSTLGKFVENVEHIGSTAIPEMAAKPVLDIMVLITDINNASSTFSLFADLNYKYFAYAEDRFPDRKWFCKPNLQHRTHHLHLVQSGTEYHRNHLLFRDFLKKNRTEAIAYLDLKKTLADRFPHDREAYTDGKTVFIERVLEIARDELNAAR